MSNQNNLNEIDPNQFMVSKSIVKYLCEKFKANMYYSSQAPIKTGYTVRYSHAEVRENDWPKNEDIALYVNRKGINNGSDTKIAIPDIALINEDPKEVKILIEVESGGNFDFKDMMRCMGPIAMADVYSPSYKFNPLATTDRPNSSNDGNDYPIKNVILFILFLGENRKQFDEMRKRRIQMLSKDESSSNNKINKITVYFDSDNNPNRLVDKFKRKLDIISSNEFNFTVTSAEKET